MKANKSINHFDLSFQGLNLSGALLALSALRSGLKVAIILDQPLKWDFEPELVTLNPLQFRKVFQSRRNLNYFEKISSLFPSLVYPQRILTVSEERKFRTKTISLIDLFLRHDREIASLPINFSKFPSFQIMANHFQNGLLVQEFRFDRKKAIIEMLLICRKLGAYIVSDQTMLQPKVTENCVFTCLPVQNRTRELKIENFRFGFSNNVRIETRNFELTSQAQKSSTILHFRIKRRIEKDVFLNRVIAILQSLGMESAESYQNEFYSIYNDFERNTNYKHIEIQLLTDHDISDLQRNCMNDGKRISKVIGKKIGLKKMIRAFKSNRFDGIGFRQLQAECDEKFDLAKQTGIDYESFSYFFYRYRLSIDDLIESAYQQMNNNRTNPQIVWKQVEMKFQKKVEKEIFS